MSLSTVLVPLVMFAFLALAIYRDRWAGGRRLEHPPEESHPAEVAYLWSAYAGNGSPDPAVRTQLLHLAESGVLELRTVGSLSDPQDLIVRLSDAPMLGPDADFVAFLFPTGRIGDEVSLRAVGADRSRSERLRGWFVGLRLKIQESLTAEEGASLLGLIRTMRGWGDAMIGRKLQLGNKWTRPEAIYVLIVAIAVQILDRGRTPWLLPVTVVAGLVVLVLMPRQLPRAVRVRLARWRAFRRYLREFASLPEAPAAAVIVWERYLVYAVALDIAGEVEDQVREVLPDRKVASMAGGGPLRFLGLGWLGMLTNPLTATQLAPAMRSLSEHAQRVASRYLGGPHEH